METFHRQLLATLTKYTQHQAGSPEWLSLNIAGLSWIADKADLGLGDWYQAGQYILTWHRDQLTLFSNSVFTWFFSLKKIDSPELTELHFSYQTTSQNERQLISPIKQEYTLLALARPARETARGQAWSIPAAREDAIAVLTAFLHLGQISVVE